MNKLIDIFCESKIVKTFFIIFAGLIVLVFLSDKIEHFLVYTKTISNVSYNSQSADKTLAAPKTFEIKDYKGDDIEKEIEITCKFKINHIKEWDDLFQTADFDKGIRLEFNKEFLGGIVINAYPSPLFGVSLGKFDNKTFNTLKFTKTLNQNAVILLNNSIINTDYNSNNFEVNKVTVGKGFDNQRVFNGEIKDFSIKYKAYKHFRVLGIILNLIKLCLLLLLLFIIAKRLKGNKEEKFSPKYLLCALMFNLYPLLFLYLRNIFELNLNEFSIFLISSSIVVLSLYFILSFFTSQIKSCIITILSIIYFYLGGHLWTLLANQDYFSPEVFVQLYSLLFISLCFLTVNSKKISEDLYKIFQFIIIVTLSLLFINNFSNLKSFYNLNTKSTKLHNEDSKTIVKNNNSPDIYFIILDAYENGEQLKKHFGFNNDKFLKGLEKKGFYVARNSHSNYNFTALSVPSMLNYSYLENLGVSNPDKDFESKLMSLYKNNAITKFLYQNNYHISYINLNALFASGFNYIDKNYLKDSSTNKMSFKNEIFKKSILPNRTKMETFQRKNVLNSFEYLQNAADYETKKPKFVFAHILSPHMPYVFMENGDVPTLLEQNDYEKKENGKSTFVNNKKGLSNQILYINKLTNKTIDNILNKKRKSVIILVSDHGFSTKYSFSEGVYNIGIDDDIETRFGNLTAIYFPDKNYSDLYQTMTPVNILRIVLNKYFNQQNSLLPEKNYYSPTTTSFKTSEITNKIKMLDRK